MKIIVVDSKIEHIWRCAGTDCARLPVPPEARVTPDWYEQNGIPVCGECGDDMAYVATSVDLGDAFLKEDR